MSNVNHRESVNVKCQPSRYLIRPLKKGGISKKIAKIHETCALPVLAKNLTGQKFDPCRRGGGGLAMLCRARLCWAGLHYAAVLVLKCHLRTPARILNVKCQASKKCECQMSTIAGV